jgi:hypothetical protein
MNAIFPITAMLVLSGCTPALEYARRSVNEPVIPRNCKLATPEKCGWPSVIVSSTARLPSTSLNINRDDLDPLSRTNIHFDFKNPKAIDIEAVRKAFDLPAPPSVFDSNKTVAKRIIVATVSKGEFRPGDRFVNFRLRLKPSNFEFVDYVGAETDYNSINIASVSFTKKNDVNIGIKGGTPIAKDVGVNVSKSVTETGVVGTRIENITVNVDYTTLDIYREAERGIDLSGNTLVGVSVTAQKTKVDDMIASALVVTAASITKNGQRLKPKAASLETANIDYLRPDDLIAEIHFDYIIRRALSKSNEYSEHNQTVAYEKGSCTREKAIIVRGRDLEIPRWNIMEVDGRNPSSPVDVNSDLGRRSLTFTDYLSAIKFAHWMREEKAAQIGTSTLIISEIGSSENKLQKIPYPSLTVIKSSENLAPNHETPLKCEVDVYR